MQIIDSQIHLWANGRMPSNHRPMLSFSADDAIREMAQAGVGAAVIHPPKAFGEASNIQAMEAARLHPDKFRVLGHLDLTSPDRLAVVRHWRQRAGMLGIRLNLNQPGQESWWSDGSLDWLWEACEEEGLPIGAMGDGHMAEIGRIALRHPSLKLHIDHLGRPHGGQSKTDEAAFADLDEMLALAKHSNVAVKLSGAPSYSSHAYPYRNIHVYIRRIFDAFGPNRCFWGTDVTRMPCTYRQCVTMFTEEMPWLVGHDLELVMGGAICRWLTWER